MMLLEVYYTIRFLKWQIYLVFLKKAKQESKKKARRKQEESKKKARRKQEESKKISSPYTLAATFG